MDASLTGHRHSKHRPLGHARPCKATCIPLELDPNAGTLLQTVAARTEGGPVGTHSHSAPAAAPPLSLCSLSAKGRGTETGSDWPRSHGQQALGVGRPVAPLCGEGAEALPEVPQPGTGCPLTAPQASDIATRQGKHFGPSSGRDETLQEPWSCQASYVHCAPLSFRKITPAPGSSHKLFLQNQHAPQVLHSKAISQPHSPSLPSIH